MRNAVGNAGTWQIGEHGANISPSVTVKIPMAIMP